MKDYHIFIPNYTVGAECYKEIPWATRKYGKTAVVIGGKTAMAKVKDALLEGIAGSDVKITDFVWYGGEATYENADALIAMDAVKNADMNHPNGWDSVPPAGPGIHWWKNQWQRWHRLQEKDGCLLREERVWLRLNPLFFQRYVWERKTGSALALKNWTGYWEMAL